MTEKKSPTMPPHVFVSLFRRYFPPRIFQTYRAVEN